MYNPWKETCVRSTNGVYHIGLGDIKNTTLQLLQQGHCDYCQDIALVYFTIINRMQHHYTRVPTAIAFLSIGMNLLSSIAVVGTNLISTLYCSIMICITWQIFCNILHYVAIFCDILHMRYYWNVKILAILILQAQILQDGDKIEILPNPSTVYVEFFCGMKFSLNRKQTGF